MQHVGVTLYIRVSGHPQEGATGAVRDSEEDDLDPESGLGLHQIDNVPGLPVRRKRRAN